MKLDKIDLLWVDTQGAELLVFQDASKILESTKYIYTEVSKIPLYAGAVPYSALCEFLFRLGFAIEREFIPDEKLGEGNVLFARK